MKATFLSILFLFTIPLAWSQTFYECRWTTDDVNYQALIIYYEDNDILVRVNYTLNERFKVAEYPAFSSSYTSDAGRMRYQIDGHDASVVYYEGDERGSYSADNFTFEVVDDEWQMPYITDDNDLNSSGAFTAGSQVDSWEEIDPTEKFTEEYVYRFFDRTEDLYKELCAYHPDYAVVHPNLDDEYPGEWRVIARESTGYEHQNWLTDPEWPKEDIGTRWDEGRRITDVSYGNGVWLVVMSTDTQIDEQSWKRSAAWPQEWIQEGWTRNKMITEVAYGDGQWLVVTSQTPKYSEQKYHVSKEWPKEWLNENWKTTNFKITSIAYGQGHWIIVLSKFADGSNPAQRIRAGATFPKEDIRTSWDEGYRISTVCYGDEWVVILNEDDNGPREAYNSGETFPRDYVDEKWSEGMRITEAVYSYREKNSSNIVTFIGTASSTGVIQNTVVHTENPGNNVNENLNPGTFNDVPTIHLIMVANTKVPDIGISCEVDRNIVVDEFTEIATALGVNLEKHIVDGDRLNRSNVYSTVSGINASSNDVIVFFYTGHGFRWSDQSSTYPRMALFYSRYESISNQNTMELEEVHRILAGKGARLTLVIGDCCNNNVGITSREGGGSLASRTYSNGSAARLRKLFFEAKGNMIVAAAQPNETSCGSPISGGYYINAFFSALDKEVSRINETDPNWSTILDNSVKSAAYKTQNLQGCTVQHGIFKSTVSH